MGAEQFHSQEREPSVENKGEMSPEQLEQYLNAEASVERAAEKSKVESGERSEAKARHEALENAISVERGSAEKKRNEPSTQPRRHGAVSKKERKNSYQRRMAQVQSEMKPTQRTFSKVIHNPVVEKTSEVLGATVARPNAILSGAVVAFILVLVVYVVAKYYGYTLSGFETIGAFIAGWALGLLYDFLKGMITGKKA